MTSYTWNGVSGDWNLAGNWTPAGGPPTTSDAATINGTATDSITVDTADVANSLTLSDANATLDDDGASASLTIGGTLAMSAGALNIATSSVASGALAVNGALNLSGGTLNINDGGQLKLGGTLSQTGGTLALNGGAISGGTIKSAAGTVAFTKSGGVLNGVTYDGTLDLSGNYDYVHLAGGTVVNNAAGTGAGTINDTGLSSYLYFDGTQTFNNATINLGNKPTNPSSLEEYDPTGAGTVLTLGSKVTIDESGSAEITHRLRRRRHRQSGENQPDGKRRHSHIIGNSFTNSGTITAASSGGTLTIDRHHVHQLRDSRHLQRRAVTIEASNFSNTGSITLASGGFALYGHQLHARRRREK